MSLLTYLAAFLPLYLASFFADFQFHPIRFVENLKYMGLGMLCIFIVIGVIIAVVLILEKVTSRGGSAE